jgi:large subunit ribosomal protein L17
MRHQKSGRTFGRRADHRHAMFSNLVSSLILSERIRTTDAKAKELKRLAERTITWGVSLGDILTRPEDKLSADERARLVHHMRMARRVCKQPEALAKLFRDVAPRYLDRPGGYTRVLKIGQRLGDAAPVSLVELLPGENAPVVEEPKGKGKGKAKAKVEETAEAAPKAKGGKAKAARPAKSESRASRGKGRAEGGDKPVRRTRAPRAK